MRKLRKLHSMMLTQENLWALELADLYCSNNQKLVRSYLINLLDLLIYLHEVLAEEKVEVHETEVLSEELIMKFYFHGISLNTLSEGFYLDSKYFDDPNFSQVKMVDLSSILTVGRSQLETLLMYQHLYMNSDDENELKLRYYAWIYTALLQRSSTPTHTEKAKQQKGKDANEIASLRSKMEDIFPQSSLSEKQQKSLIEKGNGKLFKTWDSIFKDSELTSEIFNKLYYILSVYAHSEGLSAIQMKSAKYQSSKEENAGMVFLQLFCSTLMTAVMIENICIKHKSCKSRFDQIEAKQRYTVKFLSKLSKKAIV